MAPQWEPNASSAGARAALLATASAKKKQEEQQRQQQQEQLQLQKLQHRQSSFIASQHSFNGNSGNSGITRSTSLRKASSTSAQPQASPQDGFGNSAATRATSLRKKSPPSSQTQPSQDTFGNSAATQAFKTSMSTRRPTQTPVQPTSDLNSREALGSLSAAKSVMAASRRPRSVSTPVTRNEACPGESRAAANALSAAAFAHKPTVQSRLNIGETGSVPYTALPRTMFTSHPNIGPEADDQKKADQLHASAVAMAKKMYSQQQKMADQTRANAQQGTSDVGSTGDAPEVTGYVNLQEAAYKLAQERLSKLEQEHQRSREYQEYYGGAQPGRRNTLQRRFTMKARLRRRSSSDGEVEDDRRQSEKIKKQMSIFSTNLSKVDEQKRAKDREALLAAAQKNVRARLQGMDEKVFADTGKLPPAKRLSEWELKAHEAAQAKHDSQNEHRGKVNMGGGMFMSPEEVDAIATKRVQPVLDDINEKAAVERERQEIARMEAEAVKQDEEKAKERDREIKEINRKIRDQDKQEERDRKQKEKEELKAKRDEEKAKREEEKARQAEDKKQAKEEKRRSRAVEKQAAAASGGSGVGGHDAEDTDSDENEPMTTVHPQPIIDTDAAAHAHSTTNPPHSPTKESSSPTNKVKSWFKSRFHRPRGKSSADEDGQRGFIGGAALNRGLDNANDSNTSLDNPAASMREVAMAGADRPRSGAGENTRQRDSRGVSMISRNSTDSGEGLGRNKADRAITPPPKIHNPDEDNTGSPSRDSRFKEMM